MDAQIAMVMAMVALEASALSVVITRRRIFSSLLDGKRICDAKLEGHVYALVPKRNTKHTHQICTCLRRIHMLGLDFEREVT